MTHGDNKKNDWSDNNKNETRKQAAIALLYKNAEKIFHQKYASGMQKVR